LLIGNLTLGGTTKTITQRLSYSSLKAELVRTHCMTLPCSSGTCRYFSDPPIRAHFQLPVHRNFWMAAPEPTVNDTQQGRVTGHYLA